MASVVVVQNQTFIPVSLACKLLGCSRYTIWEMLESGELKGFRPSPRAHWRVNRQSVERKFQEFKDIAFEPLTQKEIVKQNAR